MKSAGTLFLQMQKMNLKHIQKLTQTDQLGPTWKS